MSSADFRTPIKGVGRQGDSLGRVLDPLSSRPARTKQWCQTVAPNRHRFTRFPDAYQGCRQTRVINRSTFEASRQGLGRHQGLEVPFELRGLQTSSGVSTCATLGRVWTRCPRGRPGPSSGAKQGCQAVALSKRHQTATVLRGGPSTTHFCQASEIVTYLLIFLIKIK